MKKMFNLIVTFGLVLVSISAMADDGLVRVESAHSVAATADRLEAALQKKGMTVFIRINHTQGAHEVGLSIPPTEVVIFGNPRVGAPLMQCAPSVAIDLPQKMLIWQDAATGKTWLAYNDPAYLAKRHNISGCDEPLQKVANALANFAKAAAAPIKY
jgi:uncharacterized protein (DUF302 family)